jgi:toxin ParE1/3/4
VAEFRFSRRAEADLLSIGAYTLRTWGQDQTLRYIDDLETCCQMLSDNPALGRACGDVRPGLRRMECGRHVVLYREVPRGILVSRILHQRMLPERHAIDDKDAGP